MKPADERKGHETAVSHCSARNTCPIGVLCGSATRAGQPALLPKIVDVEQGQLVWTDVRYEQRALVVRSGIFACLSNPEQREELVFSLFSTGDSLGLAELYLPRSLTDAYYARALTAGQVCSFASKPLRRHLEGLPTPQREKILSCICVNSTTAMYTQVETLSKTRINDRIAILLARLKELSAREGSNMAELNLTHADIAKLVAADRVSVTRALRKMEEDGLVSLGYRSIVPTGSPSDPDDPALDFCRYFYRPEDKR